MPKIKYLPHQIEVAEFLKNRDGLIAHHGLGSGKTLTAINAANELGLSHGTLEQKLKPSADNDITVTEWNHHLDLTGDFSTLEYFALKHGFELKKLDVDTKNITVSIVLEDADDAMQESNEAWGKIKSSLRDQKLSKAEKIESLREIFEAIKALQQLQFDVEQIEIEE